jgi:hypothetical protein
VHSTEQAEKTLASGVAMPRMGTPCALVYTPVLGSSTKDRRS